MRKIICFWFGKEIVAQTLLEEGESVESARKRCAKQSSILCNRPLENPREWESKLERAKPRIY